MSDRKITEFIEYQIPFIFDSGNSSTSQLTTSDGSGFIVNLEVPLIISEDVKYAWITVYNATIWYNTYNIKLNVNDQLQVQYDDGIIVVNHTITFQPGLYDLNHMQAALERELGNVSLPTDLFKFVPDTATEKVVIEFNYTGVKLDMTIARAFRDILGFNSRLVPLAPTTTTDQFEYGDSSAGFDAGLNYYAIHTDLVQRGIRINNSYQQTIAIVNITEKPGSQINFIAKIENPRIPCNELIGTKRKNIEFWLTDNNNNRVDTNGQSWSVSLIVHYIAPTKE